MKKTIRLIVLLSLLSLGTIAFAQTSGAGVIREISGTVELKAPGAANFVAANIGDQVNQETVISTGFRSTALVELGGSTVIAVRPLTRLTLTEITAAEGTETLNVNLQAGRVRVDVHPPAGTRASMSVSSPQATASVRGTTFWFDGANVSVGDGAVDFSGTSGNIPMPVSAGSVSSVDTGGKAMPAVFTGVGRTTGSIGSATGGDTSQTVVTLTGSDSNAGLTPSAPIGSEASSAPPSPAPAPAPAPPPGPPPGPPDPGPAPGPSPSPSPSPALCLVKFVYTRRCPAARKNGYRTW